MARKTHSPLAEALYRQRHHVADVAFRLERWLNPYCYPWGDGPERPDPRFSRSRHGSPIAVIGLLDQVRKTLDDLLRIFGWQVFCGRPESKDRPASLPASTTWKVPTEVGYVELIGFGDEEVPGTVAHELEYQATQLLLELEDFPRPTANQISKTEIRECATLAEVLAARIRRYQRERANAGPNTPIAPPDGLLAELTKQQRRMIEFVWDKPAVKRYEFEAHVWEGKVRPQKKSVERQVERLDDRLTELREPCSITINDEFVKFERRSADVDK